MAAAEELKEMEIFIFKVEVKVFGTYLCSFITEIIVRKIATAPGRETGLFEKN